MADYSLQSTWAEVDAAAQAQKNGVNLQQAKQTTKTDTMTQSVGVDANGKLWVPPVDNSAPVFYITASISDNAVTADKTLTEITAAYNAGKMVLLRYAESAVAHMWLVMPIIQVSPEMDTEPGFVFGTAFMTGPAVGDPAAVCTVTVTSRGWDRAYVKNLQGGTT